MCWCQHWRWHQRWCWHCPAVLLIMWERLFKTILVVLRIVLIHCLKCFALSVATATTITPMMPMMLLLLMMMPIVPIAACPPLTCCLPSCLLASMRSSLHSPCIAQCNNLHHVACCSPIILLNSALMSLDSFKFNACNVRRYFCAWSKDISFQYPVSCDDALAIYMSTRTWELVLW